MDSVLSAVKGAATTVSGLKAAIGAPVPTAKVPLWLWKALAIFPLTGLLGVDYYSTGSTETAVAKFLLNLVTLGAWYFHDALYAFDGNKIMDEGLKFPFLETVSVKPGVVSAAAPFDTNAKTLLFVLLTGFAALIYGIAWLFAEMKGIVGDISKVMKTISGAATGALGTFTGYTAYLQAQSAALAKVAAAIPGGTQITDLAKTAGLMKGGAKSEGVTADFFALGTLFVLAFAGFALSAVRSKSVMTP
jgi:hypothetical protein